MERGIFYFRIPLRNANRRRPFDRSATELLTPSCGLTRLFVQQVWTLWRHDAGSERLHCDGSTCSRGRACRRSVAACEAVGGLRRGWPLVRALPGELHTLLAGCSVALVVPEAWGAGTWFAVDGSRNIIRETPEMSQLHKALSAAMREQRGWFVLQPDLQASLAGLARFRGIGTSVSFHVSAEPCDVGGSAVHWAAAGGTVRGGGDPCPRASCGHCFAGDR